MGVRGGGRCGAVWGTRDEYIMQMGFLRLCALGEMRATVNTWRSVPQVKYVINITRQTKKNDKRTDRNSHHRGPMCKWTGAHAECWCVFTDDVCKAMMVLLNAAAVLAKLPPSCVGFYSFYHEYVIQRVGCLWALLPSFPFHQLARCRENLVIFTTYCRPLDLRINLLLLLWLLLDQSS